MVSVLPKSNINGFIKINPNETVLDVGTNNGALLVYICKKGGIATGIEINSEAIEICKLTLKANDINATLINKDFTLWEEDVKFDVIVSNPPYFDSKEEKQKSSNQHKRLARHEGTLNLKSYVDTKLFLWNVPETDYLKFYIFQVV